MVSGPTQYTENRLHSVIKTPRGVISQVCGFSLFGTRLVLIPLEPVCVCTEQASFPGCRLITASLLLSWNSDQSESIPTANASGRSAGEVQSQLLPVGIDGSRDKPEDNQRLNSIRVH